jgi:hypothetical protein
MWHEDKGRVEHVLAEVSRIREVTYFPSPSSENPLSDEPGNQESLLDAFGSDREGSRAEFNCIRKVVSRIAYHFPLALQMP